METRKILLLIALIVAAQSIWARQRSYDYLFGNNKTQKTGTDLMFYGGLQHQHQDFFNNAFSFQGVEAGVLLKNSI